MEHNGPIFSQRFGLGDQFIGRKYQVGASFAQCINGIFSHIAIPGFPVFIPLYIRIVLVKQAWPDFLPEFIFVFSHPGHQKASRMVIFEGRLACLVPRIEIGFVKIIIRGQKITPVSRRSARSNFGSSTHIDRYSPLLRHRKPWVNTYTRRVIRGARNSYFRHPTVFQVRVFHQCHGVHPNFRQKPPDEVKEHRLIHTNSRRQKPS